MPIVSNFAKGKWDVPILLGYFSKCLGISRNDCCFNFSKGKWDISIFPGDFSKFLGVSEIIGVSNFA